MPLRLMRAKTLHACMLSNVSYIHECYNPILLHLLAFIVRAKVFTQFLSKHGPQGCPRRLYLASAGVRLDRPVMPATGHQTGQQRSTSSSSSGAAASASAGTTGLSIRTTLSKPRERKEGGGVWGYQPCPGSPAPSRDVLRFIQSLDLVRFVVCVASCGFGRAHAKVYSTAAMFTSILSLCAWIAGLTLQLPTRSTARHAITQAC